MLTSLFGRNGARLAARSRRCPGTRAMAAAADAVQSQQVGLASAHAWCWVRWGCLLAPGAGVTRPDCMGCDPAVRCAQVYAFGPHTIQATEVFVTSKLCYAFVNLKPIVPGGAAARLQLPWGRG
jgi:hypothetical protein